MAEPLRVGIVGAGAIGACLCRALRDGTVSATLSGVCEIDPARRAALGLDPAPPFLTLDELADRSDVIVEAAAPGAVEAVVRAGLAAGCDVVIMSLSGLLGRDDLIEAARLAGRRLHLPTGAIAGLDALRAMAVGGLEAVTLTTTKPPAGLVGAPYLTDQGISLDGLSEPTLVFDGSAREAAAGFPKNVNVAAALSLAGLGPDRTRVRVVADPRGAVNRHEIEMVGAAGRVTVCAENVPSPDNPRTSYLAALSAVALLQRLTATVQVGT